MKKIPLAAVRVAQGWTQKQLAEKLGVSTQLVWEWENGKSVMKPVYLFALCHLTGFTEDSILLPSESSLT